MVKNCQNFFSSKYDNSYTNRKKKSNIKKKHSPNLKKGLLDAKFILVPEKCISISVQLNPIELIQFLGAYHFFAKIISRIFEQK
jgi:hypothetical protein